MPDFSGSYLRRGMTRGDTTILNPAPIVLQVTQSADRLRVLATLNDSEVNAEYDLTSQSPRQTPSGWKITDHVKTKHRELRIETDRSHSHFGTAQQLGWAKLEQRWQLSHDGKTLTIRREYSSAAAPRVPVREQEIYVRQSSLQEAIAQSAALAGPNKCNLVPDELKKKSQDRPHTLYGEGAALGSTTLERVDESVLISADLSGPFFKRLEKVTETGQTTFREAGQKVTEFPDSISFEAQPSPRPAMEVLRLVSARSGLG